MAAKFGTASAPIALLALLLPPYLINLGDTGFWDSDELFNIEPPREMLELGDWLMPHYNYEPFFGKPPLSYWIGAAFYKTMGVSELSARMPGALAAIALVALTFLLGRELFSRSVGLLAATLLAATVKFFFFARFDGLDVMLSLLIALSLYAFMLCLKRGSAAWFLVSCVAASLAVLNKGPVGAILPAGVVASYLVWARERINLKLKHLIAGIAIAAAVALPWYAMALERFGYAYVNDFFFRHNIRRFYLGDLGHEATRGLAYYPLTILANLFPWSLFLPQALVLASARIKAQAQTRGSYMLLLSWTGFVLLFFTLSAGKREPYMLPLYPAAFILLGAFLVGLPSESGIYRLSAKVAYWIMAALAMPCLWLLFALSASLPGGRLAGSHVAFAALMGFALAWLVLALARSQLERLHLLTCALLGLLLWFVVLELPRWKELIPEAKFAAKLEPLLCGNEPIAFFGRPEACSLMFHLKRPITKLSSYGELLAFISENERAFLILREDVYASLDSRARSRLEVIDVHPAPTFIARPRQALKLIFAPERPVAENVMLLKLELSP